MIFLGRPTWPAEGMWVAENVLAKGERKMVVRKNDLEENYQE